jgi:hypothetical protein
MRSVSDQVSTHDPELNVARCVPETEDKVMNSEWPLLAEDCLPLSCGGGGGAVVGTFPPLKDHF